MSKLNPLEHPICFTFPNRLTSVNSWHGHIPFAMFLVDILKPKMIVEIGTHYGDSYCAFCQAVKELKLETRCYAVDTWQGDPQAGQYGPDVLTDLRAYHDPLYGSFSRLIQSTFDEALAHFDNESIDILHIDGYHIYEMVKHDFESWLPKVSQRGIILLHDINVLERDYGARRFWDEIKSKYPNFEFLHSHGLGVLAPGKIYSLEIQQFFNAKTEEIAGLREFFSQLGERINSKVTINAKNNEIQNLKNELILKESSIIKLNNIKPAIEEKNTLINALESGIKEKNTQILKLNNEIQIQQAQIEDLNSQFNSKDNQIRDLNKSLQSGNNQLYNLQIQLYQIQNGIPMRIRNKYQRIIEKLLPGNTGRRRYYQLGIKGIKVILNEGWRSFFRKVKRYRASKRPIKIKVEPLKLKPIPEDVENEIKLVDKEVSIIIPTKNAGADFEVTLKRIQSQKGIKKISLIIIDSGSCDGTVPLAKKYGAEIYTIKPEEFNHGSTRNLGATYARGDCILFMVQDAIPIGEYWLYDILTALYNADEIAGITCRQVPQSDADLYYWYILAYHYKYMGFDKNKIVQNITGNFDNLSFTEKRKLAGIDDVCFCIKRDIFDNFKFKKLDFAEDLDLGMRLIGNDYKIGFLHSVGVIHSHRRNADYFLKRNYVNNKILVDSFKMDTSIKELDVDVNLEGIIYLYSYLKQSLNLIITKYSKEIEVQTFFIELKELIKGYSFQNKIETEGNIGLDVLLNELEKILEKKPSSNHLLFDSYFMMLNDLQDFLMKVTNRFEVIELKETAYKLYATLCGSYLGELFTLKSSDEKMKKIDILLKKGV